MKALVLFSGGLDSTVCLAMACSKYGADNVLALSVSYGQKHQKEIEAARAIVKHFKCHHKELDLKKIFEESDCTLLKGRADIPHSDYETQLKERNGEAVSTYVPFRNGLFLSCAASVALSNGCEEIYYGIHADDAAGNAYPDTSTAFNDSINNAVYIGSGNKLKVVAPFVNKNKADVVKMGLSLNAPFHLTWSCYEGHDKACGTCGTCIDRKKAFEANGVSDPIEYEV